MGRGRRKLFSEQEREEIYRKYVSGLSQIKLSIEYDCCEQTIGNICRAKGGSLHSRTLSMMMHDWNTGMDVHKLMAKYKYNSRGYLNKRICALRKKGMPFSRRGVAPTNAFKRKTAKELNADMVKRQMPIRECEQVFMDAVRESRGL